MTSGSISPERRNITMLTPCSMCVCVCVGSYSTWLCVCEGESFITKQALYTSVVYIGNSSISIV